MPIASVVKAARANNHSQKTVKNLIAQILNKIYLKRIFVPLFQRLEPLCQPQDTILDIGSGSCYLTSLFQQKKYKITPIDIDNLSIFSDITPLVYNGSRLPFGPKKFDLGLLINVLHHAQDPHTVLHEALRVCRRVIVHEDTPKTKLEALFLQLADMIGNCEFRRHHHQTPAWWKKYLAKQKLRVSSFSTYTTFANNFFMFGRYSFFVVQE